MKHLILFSCLALHIFISHGVNAAEPNIVLGHKVSSNISSPNLNLLTDGQYAPEGANWDSPLAVTSKDKTADYVIDLGANKEIRALILQADWNDSYLVSSSTDGLNWKEIWVAETVNWGQGLRRRSVVLSAPQTAHFLKIRAGINDGVLSLSEFQVFSSLPPDWDTLTLKGLVNTPMQWWSFLTTPHVEYLRMMLAALVVMLVCWRLGAGTAGEVPWVKKTLIVLTALAAMGWCNFFVFHWGSLIHRHDVFHYYLGSKYSPELGYLRLYPCAAVADQEDIGPQANANRMIRNLESNEIENVKEIIAHPEQCKSRFSQTRWNQFKRDLTWFRQSLSPDEYSRVLKDHGYNATPVWNLTGYLISNLAPATTAQLNFIGLLDPIILTAAFIFCGWQFGLWSTALALVFFGTNFIASFAWTGGAFLRLDWLFYLMLGLAFLKRSNYFPAGFFLVCSGLVRIFPFAFLAGLFLKIGIEAFREKSKAPLLQYKWLYAGALTSALVLVPLSTAATSMGHWTEFINNTTKHFNTLSTNMMGLSVIAAYSPETRTEIMQDDKLPDPFEHWKTAKKDLLSKRKILVWAFEFLILALMVLALMHAEPWEAAVLGMGFIFLIRLSNYDYYFLLPLAFLWEKEKRAGLGLVFLAWVSWALPHLQDRLDDQYFWATLLCLGLYLGLLWRLTHPITYLKTLRRS